MEFYIDHPEKMDIHATQKFHATKKCMESMQQKNPKFSKFAIFTFKKNELKVCKPLIALMKSN